MLLAANPGIVAKPHSPECARFCVNGKLQPQPATKATEPVANQCLRIGNFLVDTDGEYGRRI
jgi:hypothetical protein